MTNKRKNRVIASVTILTLGIMAYYGYWSGQKVLNEGVYSIGTITETSRVLKGIKTLTEYYYNGKRYEVAGVVDIDRYSLKDKGRRKFIVFLPTNPDNGIWSIPEVPVPDSLEAPDKGWSEEWMLEHYPEVVREAHDTR